MSIFSRYFVHHDIKNVKYYYALIILTNCWFVEGNWFFYWTRFMTITEVGALFGIMSLFGLILEIPTGTLADRFGRRKVVIGAFIAQALGIWITAFAGNFWLLAVGAAVHQVGMRLESGALEALLYDSLVETKNESIFDSLTAKSTQLSTIVAATTILIGGILYHINFRLSYIAWALALTMAFIFSIKLVDPVVKHAKEDAARYVRKLKDGVKQLGSKTLRPYLILIFIYLSLYLVYDWGFVKPAMAVSFGFYDREQSILYATLAVFSALLLSKFTIIRKRIGNDLIGMRLLLTILGLGFFIAMFRIGIFGIIPFLMIELASNLAWPWTSVIVNKHTASGHRATTLSAITFLTNIPYTLTIFLVADVTDNFGIGRVIGIITLVVFTVLVYNTIRYPAKSDINLADNVT